MVGAVFAFHGSGQARITWFEGPIPYPTTFRRQGKLEKTDTQGSCTYKQGSLPECAPLALAQIPAQKSSEPAYKSGEALSRGTLFPGLDLPFKTS